MSTKTLVFIGVTVGSIIGGYIPSLWGADIFSMWSLVLSAVGGLFGIWVGFRIGNS